MRAGALASLTGVSADTLRHYERKGLIDKPPRSSGGYRLYPPAAVARVQLIQRALVIGFSLNELSRVLRERDRGGAPCRSVRTLVGERLEQLEARIDDLMALKTELKSRLATWDSTLAATPAGARAHLLEGLGRIRRPSASRARPRLI